MGRSKDKQFTLGELSFIRYVFKKCISMYKTSYEDDRRVEHIVNVIDELLYDVDNQIDNIVGDSNG